MKGIIIIVNFENINIQRTKEVKKMCDLHGIIYFYATGCVNVKKS
jgi:hypothetical protein